MPQTVVWPSGTSNTTPTAYPIPLAGEVNWASLTNFLVALGQNAQGTTFQRFADRIAITTPVTVSTNDCIVGVALTVPAAVVVNLPAGVDKTIFFIVDAAANAKTDNITIMPNGADTINGAASLVLATNGQSVMLVYNSATTNWLVVMNNGIDGSDIGGFTPNSAIVSDSGGFLTSSATTADEIAHVITALTGDVTAAGPGSVAATLVATTNGTLTTLSALTTAAALVTVGTITTGTWQGTTVAVNKGGTGTTSFTTNGIVYSGTPTALGSTGAGTQYQVLQAGASSVPVFAALALNQAAAVTGTLPIGNGGTGVTSATTVPAAAAFAGWDANKNLSANSFLAGYATTATAASTTMLTVASAYQQYFTGVTTQTVVLPVTSTLVLGQSFQIVNLSNSTVTVQSSGANTVQAMAANTSATFTCILTTGTSAASWSVEYLSTTGAGTVTSVAMTVPAFLSISGSPITTSGTLAVGFSGTALPVANGGTGLTAGTSGGVLAYTATGTLASSAALTANQLIVGGGAGAVPATLAAGTNNQFLKMNGTPIPAWYTIPAPTQQTFTTSFWSFTIASSSIVIGTTYSTGQSTFVVTATTSSSTTLVASGSSNPPTTGTLTYVSGPTTGNHAFSAVSQITQTYTVTSSAVKYLRVRGVGGGAGGNATAPSSNGVAGTATLFSSILTANGGSPAASNSANGGAGGTVSLTTSASVYGNTWSGGSGSGGTFTGSATISPCGGSGGNSIFGGGAGGGTGGVLAQSGVGGSGAGGGGGGGTNVSSQNVAPGGGAGGGFDFYIVGTLASTYTLQVGAAGVYGAGTNNGGYGGFGMVEITEFYV